MGTYRLIGFSILAYVVCTAVTNMERFLRASGQQLYKTEEPVTVANMRQLLTHIQRLRLSMIVALGKSLLIALWLGLEGALWTQLLVVCSLQFVLDWRVNFKEGEPKAPPAQPGR